MQDKQRSGTYMSLRICILSRRKKRSHAKVFLDSMYLDYRIWETKCRRAKSRADVYPQLEPRYLQLPQHRPSSNQRPKSIHHCEHVPPWLSYGLELFHHTTPSPTARHPIYDGEPTRLRPHRHPKCSSSQPSSSSSSSPWPSAPKTSTNSSTSTNLLQTVISRKHTVPSARNTIRTRTRTPPLPLPLTLIQYTNISQSTLLNQSLPRSITHTFH